MESVPGRLAFLRTRLSERWRETRPALRAVAIGIPVVAILLAEELPETSTPGGEPVRLGDGTTATEPMRSYTPSSPPAEPAREPEREAPRDPAPSPTPSPGLLP